MIETVNIDLVLDFLKTIGIDSDRRDIPEPSFLPGIKIEAGRLVVDVEKLKYPGDLLHEAGHIAVTPSAERLQMFEDVKNDSLATSLEIVTILWSFAALRHLNLPTAFVFHEGGYKGQSDWFIEQFESGNYIGLPLLQWMGMTVDEKKALELNLPPFPYMLKWLRD